MITFLKIQKFAAGQELCYASLHFRFVHVKMAGAVHESFFYANGQTKGNQTPSLSLPHPIQVLLPPVSPSLI